MNNIVGSLAFGLAFLVQAAGANAAASKQADPESGCRAALHADSSEVATPASPDGLSWRRGVSPASTLGDSVNGVRLQFAAFAEGDKSLRVPGEVGLERLSSRVEKLGQGIVAASLVQSLIPAEDDRQEQRQEPKLSVLLLAAAGVAAFVARRRRTG